MNGMGLALRIGVINLYRLRGGRWKLNAKKTIAQDDVNAEKTIAQDDVNAEKTIAQDDVNANKTIAQDDVTWRATARKILKKINYLAAQIELTQSILLSLPWNLLSNLANHFHICSYSVTYLFWVKIISSESKYFQHFN